MLISSQLELHILNELLTCHCEIPLQARTLISVCLQSNLLAVFIIRSTLVARGSFRLHDTRSPCHIVCQRHVWGVHFSL